MSTVYIEDSNTPIYRRIAYAIGNQLARCGFNVLVVKPDGFNVSTFLQFLSQQEGASVYISNREHSIIETTLPGRDEYFFESFPGKLIFIHQDTILGGVSVLSNISKLQAWKRINERSAHLCIEPDNVADMASIGITHARLVPHATEIELTEPSINDFQYGATFVGHAVPGIYSSTYIPIENHEHIKSLINQATDIRRSNFSEPLQGLVKSYSDEAINGIGDPDDQKILKVASAQWIRSQIAGQTLPLRGWIFENCDIQPLTIFGGDPAYLHGVERNLRVNRNGVDYQSAIYEPQQIQHIFNKSKVSINISSLQFDYAVVNRFHDVIMSGGLCLTDARSGLAKLTSAYQDVSFRNLEELNDRAKYFSRPENAYQRVLLIKTIQKEIIKNTGYPLLTQAIIEALKELY